MKRDGIEAASTSFVAEQLGVDENAVNFKSGYESASAHYGYLRQSHVSSFIPSFEVAY